jgi:VIT1/CCC1 family predicted Fe2+/Mn2+ transporter
VFFNVAVYGISIAHLKETLVIPHTLKETHRASRINWLRAAVLGANDGTTSIASLVVGVAAAGSPHENILLTGVAGLVAGAMSMAAGEYVSVQSQSDTEKSDIESEKRELEAEPERELEELTKIYFSRGLDQSLARLVAEKLTSSDALGTHSRDELGITETLRARPIQAAFTSAISFVAGAIIPIAAAFLAPAGRVTEVTVATTCATLVILGGTSAFVGGASVTKGSLRVAFWGMLAMGLTAVVGRLFGAVV